MRESSFSELSVGQQSNRMNWGMGDGFTGGGIDSDPTLPRVKLESPDPIEDHHSVQ